MRVFITGASGFIGTAVTRELIGAGHQVLGMTRSDDGARALFALGAEVHRGTLEDLDSLKAGARAADAVIHLAFNHDFSRYIENCEDDRRAIEAMGSALAGSGRGLVVTSGTGMARNDEGQPAKETDKGAPSSQVPRAASEEAADAVAATGVTVSVVRLPQVHDRMKHGLVSPAIETAKARGMAVYIGEGANRWPAAHVSDTARLYRLALERAVSGARYHAVAEEAITMRQMVEAIGRRLDVPVKSIKPEEAVEYFGVMAGFASLDMPASSALTREWLGWTPTGPGMIQDIAAPETVG